jgi:hypothetical protein
MSYGLKIYNSSGYLQVDTNTMQYAVHSIGGISGTYEIDLGVYGAKLPMTYINGNWIKDNALAMRADAAETPLPFYGYVAASDRIEVMYTHWGAATFARLSGRSVAPNGSYGLKILDTDGTGLLLNTNDSFFCVRQEITLTTGATTNSVSVPINFGPYPTTSSVWVLCNTGLYIHQDVRTGVGTNINRLVPKISRSGNNIICKVESNPNGFVWYASEFPTTRTNTFIIGIIL